MGKKAKIKVRRRIVVRGALEEFHEIGVFLREFNRHLFTPMVWSQSSASSRKGDLVIEVVPEVDSRKEERLAGWFRVGPHRAQVVLTGATDDQLAKFADSLRKEWFPTEEEKRERESERRRSILEKMLSPLEAEILRYRLSMDKLTADQAPLKTD